MTLEEALRERYQQAVDNIDRIESLKKEWGDKTHWRTPEDKRYRDRLNEKIQIEWYKRTEHTFLASKAGINLANASREEVSKNGSRLGPELQTTTKGERAKL
jgi:hypothetical protein